jgi:hypothetical protein
MSEKSVKKDRRLRKSTEQLEVACDRAERAYWKACHALPEWTAWQMAEKFRDCHRHELRKAFYVKVNDFPEWRAYEEAWRALQRRYDL